MRYSLLISDISAFLIGLVGLYATALFLTAPGWLEATQIQTLLFLGAFSAFSLVGALVFLLPGTHQRVLHLTCPIPLRLIFVALGVVWLFLSYSIVQTRGSVGIPLLGELFAGRVAPALVIVAAVLFAVTIFPLGLAYREPRRVRREQAALRKSQRRAARLERRAMAEVGAIDLRAAVPTRRMTRGEKAVETSTLSRLIGFLVSLAAVASIAAVYALPTVPGPELIALLVANAPILAAAGFAAILLGQALSRLEDREGYPLRRSFGQKLGVIVRAALVGTATAFLVGYFGVPAGRALATEGPVETRPYEITHRLALEFDFAPRCVLLKVPEAPVGLYPYCGFSDEIWGRIGAGDTIAFTGEATEWGHSLTTPSLDAPEATADEESRLPTITDPSN